MTPLTKDTDVRVTVHGPHNHIYTTMGKIIENTNHLILTPAVPFVTIEAEGKQFVTLRSEIDYDFQTEDWFYKGFIKKD